MTEHDDAHQEANDLEGPTPGAQRQIDAISHRVDRGLRAMKTVVVLLLVGFAATGWQIKRAFDHQDAERLARVGASASINTFLCQRIDSVGNGVAALVRVSLGNSPPPDQLSEAQHRAYRRFVRYAKEQERPPRCRQLALKIATLTGADPDEIEITAIHLHPRR
jgi:hypothetical protein